MRKIVLTIFLLLIPLSVFADGRNMYMMPAYSESATGTTPIKNYTQQLAIQYWPQTTSPIKGFCLYENVNGTGGASAFNFTWRVETDDGSNLPSGVTLGGTVEFVGASADGWGSQYNLSSDTGNLVIGTPVCPIVNVSAGTPDNANWMGWISDGGDQIIPGYIKHYNGTAWVTVETRAQASLVVVHEDGTLGGLALQGGDSTSGLTDIYQNDTQGLRGKFGCNTTISGILFIVDKAGSPGDLTLYIYEEDTEKYNITIPVGSVSDISNTISWFNPTTITANKNFTILFKQSAGTDSNDYDWFAYTANSNFINAAIPVGWGLVSGNISTTTPDNMTLANNKVPKFKLFFTNTSSDFMSGGGGETVYVDTTSTHGYGHSY